MQNLDSKNMINSFDFVILSKIVTTDTLKTGKCGRNSGGLALLYKLKFDDWISVQKESPNFLWFKLKLVIAAQKLQKTFMSVERTFHHPFLATFDLNYLKSLKATLGNSPPLVLFLLWETLTPE